MIITRATTEDVEDVAGILNRASEWLAAQGFDQWPNGFPTSRIARIIDKRMVFLVRDGETPAATVTVSRHGDPDFWWPAERAESAAYISKLAVDRPYVGRGLGSLLLRWVGDREARGYKGWLRLDAWRTNPQLQDYYKTQGWTHLRTVELAGRRSGALFQTSAREDEAARTAFTAGTLPSLFTDDSDPEEQAKAAAEAASAWARLEIGDRVVVRYGGRHWSNITSGRITDFLQYTPGTTDGGAFEHPNGVPDVERYRRTCTVLADDGTTLTALSSRQVRAEADFPSIGTLVV